MPKMTHWNSRETVDVDPAKAAVYQAQGWVRADGPTSAAAKPEPDVTAMTTAEVDTTDAAEPAPKPAKKATKKPAKRAAKKV